MTMDSIERCAQGIKKIAKEATQGELEEALQMDMDLNTNHESR